MKILVTGGNGLVGSALKNIKTNHNLVFVGKTEADLTDGHAVKSLFRTVEPDAVIHCAARVGGIGGNLNSPIEYFHENILMNTHVVHNAFKHHVEKLLAFSSVCVFPDGLSILKEELMHEGQPYYTQYAYASAKRAMDVQIQTINNNCSLYSYCSIIPTNIFGTCFDSETEVLTLNGIKNIKDLKIHDKVYTLNPITHEVEIGTIINTIKNTTNKWITFKSKGVDFKVTPDHKMYYRRNKNFIKRSASAFIGKSKFFGQITFAHHKLKSTDIDEYDSYNVSLIEHIDSNQIVYLNEKNMISDVKDYKHSHSKKIPIEYKIDDFIEFIGWYVSEGCITTINKDKEQYQIIITQDNIKNKENCDRISNCLSRMKIPFGYSGKNFYFSSRLWHKYLIKTIGNNSENKKLPNFIFDEHFPQKLRKILFNTLMLGDGNKNGKRYSTNSFTLKNQFIHLCFLLGYKAAEIKKEQIKDYLPILRVGIRLKRKETTVKYKNIIDIDVTNEDSYCITTNINNIIYAGRNGKFNWIGQCDNYNLDNGHVIPSLMHKIYLAKKDGKPLKVWGDGTAKRELLFADDLARILMQIIDLDKIPQRIIVSRNGEVSIKEIVEKLCKISNFKGEIIWETNKPNGQKSRVTDLTVLRSLIGEPEYTNLDEALAISYNWFEESYFSTRK